MSPALAGRFLTTKPRGKFKNYRFLLSYIKLFFLILYAKVRRRLNVEQNTSKFSSVQSLSCVQLFVTSWTSAHQASLSTFSQSLLKLMVVMSSNHLILCHSHLPLPSIFTNIRVFSSELVLRIRWPKYWSFSFSISPSNEYSRLIPFRMDWVDLLLVQGTFKALLQHHSSIQSISSLVLSFLYGPTLTSIHDYWKNHSFD